MRIFIAICTQLKYRCVVATAVRPLARSIDIREMSSKQVPADAQAGASSIPENSKSRVAISHMRATSQKADNMNQVRTIVERAKQQNAQFLFLPECCDFVGENRNQTLDLSEPLTGPVVTAYRELARTNRIWISAGGVHEAIMDANGAKTDKINNTHVIIDDCGDLIATYRKLHLFDVDTPAFRFRESNVVAPGNRIVAPVQTPIGSIGMQICYDVRFGEVATILRKSGAEILTYPSAFAHSTGAAHWSILLKARAIENQCYVIASAQIGFHNAKRQSYGHAMIVGPWGETIAECNSIDLDVAVGELDREILAGVRSNMPCFDHRRTDIYTLQPLRIVDVTQSSTTERSRRLLCNDDMNLKFGRFVIPERTVFYCSEYCFAFTNIRCVVPGHVLVATKRSVRRLKDMTGDEITDFFQTVCKVQKCTETIYRTTSSTVTVQDGIDAGQTVQHVHCHIMPRKAGDFAHNDQIYIELNRHDHDETAERRPVEDMEREATRYRQYFHENY